jgi:methionyl aminopeptidase
LKIDYGIQFNGEMVDAAFSITHNPELEKLKEISEEATNKVIKLSGVDTVLGDLGREIEEIFTSYELEINGKLYPIKPCRDLCGHQILPYKIHGKKVIPNINISYQNRMAEGEIYAVETFPTTGSGHLKEGKGNSHLMINYNIVGNDKYTKIPTYKRIMDKRKTLPWHLDWLEKDPFIKLNELQLLIDEGVVTEYPPLYDIESSYVAQTEHTIGIYENGVVQYT